MQMLGTSMRWWQHFELKIVASQMLWAHSVVDVSMPFICVWSPGQTRNVWLPKIIKHCLVIKHFAVWAPCLMISDRVWTPSNNIKHFFCSHVCLVMFGSFGQVYQTCLARAGEMRYRHVEMVVILWARLWHTTPCVRMFDKTCLNRLDRASSIKMFDHQTMFHNVWSSNISHLARA